ncbi:hypothetical protein LQ384_12115 [Rhodococcus rhodochrous]|jgi:hypothetical protein|uniref:Transmembrane protein n=1 Tax=Rhodococcus rhodochrous TaxID=1829 RepID=A0AAW4XEI4_RHORH|nr:MULTISPECIES: hypothetical protein [Rhodococcus]MCD2111848.1 hypothetical protein [Rhodococcus rhodochrous]WAL45817.1 hypothetical protein OQN32_20545 [Rhodococcus pyridinivorans]
MAENNPFGFDPEDLDRVVREAGEELRELKDRIFSFLEPPVAPTRTQPRPETTGEKGDGVWVVYTTDDDGVARVDQVHRTELDALRTLKGNTDPRRSVRFLPYGMSVSILDRPSATEDSAAEESATGDTAPDDAATGEN